MSDLRAALAEALGPLYRVEREVRPAGDDRQFVIAHVPVGAALLVKVLPAAASLTLDERHVERELLLLADRLQHPHLVAPKGGGRAGACIYHTRPFIAGTTLRAWIDRHGAVPLTRGVEVLRAVLSGLAHAHEHGVAHGSLRAEAVLLGHDGVMVADTGVAAALGGRTVRRNDMVAFGELAHHMFAGRRTDAEPLADTRSLPPWLSEFLDQQWSNAAEALAAFGNPT